MDFDTMTDDAVANELGSRLKALRLRQNISQEKLSKDSGLSLNTIKSLERGMGKLINLIAVLRTLNALPELDSLLPEQPISPMALLKSKNNIRQRAGTKRNNPPTYTSKPEGESEW